MWDLETIIRMNSSNESIKIVNNSVNNINNTNEKCRCVTIYDGYRFWHPKLICTAVEIACYNKYQMSSIVALNRLQLSLLFEFYLHNIAYYLTKPKLLKRFRHLGSINLRAKNVSLEEKKGK